MKQKFLEANNDKKRKNDLIILSLPNDYKLLDGMTSGCQQCYVENDFHKDRDSHYCEKLAQWLWSTKVVEEKQLKDIV